MASRIPFGAFRGEGAAAKAGESGPEAATQTYLHGAVLIDNGAGFLTEAGANPALNTILGIANNPGQNGVAAGDKTTSFTPRNRDMVFLGSIGNAADPTADTATCLDTDRWALYGITKGTDGKWFVDKTKTGVNSRVFVTEIVDPIGTLRGRVAFKFLDTEPA